MLRRWLALIPVAVVAVTVIACGHGPSEPMPPDPMDAVVADSLGR